MDTINQLADPLAFLRAVSRKRDPVRAPAATNQTARDAAKAALQSAVKTAKAAHDAAVKALDDFARDPVNNVFETLEAADRELENELRNRAEEDCVGDHNCAADRYEQRFFVGGVEYVAIADVECNRFDKRLYWVEYFKFRIEPVA